MKLLLMLVVFFAYSAHAQVKIIDGDSLNVDGKEIRLVNIDSPEYFQTCYDSNNVEYECGYEAYLYLKILVENGLNQGKDLNCKKVGTDKYNRELSECFIGKTNLNRLMVKSGHAVSYWEDKYKNLENKAKKSKKGVWQGKFMRPELYRVLKKAKKQ